MRTSPKKKAKELAKLLRHERPDYDYLKVVFKELRAELEIEIPKKKKTLPYVPTEDEIKRYYDAVWSSKNFQDMIIIKMFLYTGIRVSELVNLKITDVLLNESQIKINDGKGHKDRIVPFPSSFKELLALFIDQQLKKNSVYLFESSWNKKYTDRGIRKILEKYSTLAKLSKNVSPHKLRHYLFTWLKKQGIDDALIQPYSGHESRKSLEIYSKLSINDAQTEYNKHINNFVL